MKGEEGRKVYVWIGNKWKRKQKQRKGKERGDERVSKNMGEKEGTSRERRGTKRVGRII